MDYSVKKTAVDNALDGCGIGHEVRGEFAEATEAINRFAASFLQAAHSQLTNNLLVNVPCDIMTVKEGRESVVKLGLVSAISSMLEWDIKDTMLFCGDLLEDVNLHDEAALMRNKAGKPVEDCEV